MSTLRNVVTRLLDAGLDDLDALCEACQSELSLEVSRRTVAAYRSAFRRYGIAWAEQENERHRSWGRVALAKKLTGQARQSAAKRDLEFALDADEVDRLLSPMTCAVTKLPLTLEHYGPSARNPWAPSLDRIDGSKGYVSGNVRVVCWAYNLMRADFPDEVVRKVAQALMVPID